MLISHLPASIKRSADAPNGSFPGFDSLEFCAENDAFPDAESFSNLNSELNGNCRDAAIKTVFVKGPSDRGK